MFTDNKLERSLAKRSFPELTTVYPIYNKFAIYSQETEIPEFKPNF